ncbi:MAG TPA: ABC transporter permease, partial [Polyangiales bacterium]
MRARWWLTIRRVLALSDKEVRHVLRDPRTLYLALAMPAVLLLLFGFGVSFDLDHLPVAFVDLDRSEVSRDVCTRLAADDLFDDLYLDAPALKTGAEAERALIAGEVIMVVLIERGFSADLASGQSAQVQLLIDGSDNSSAVQARSRAEVALRTLGLTANARPLRALPGMEPIEARTFTRFNPEARSAVFLVPGITAYVLAIVAVLLTALTVAREWERGSMAQLFATPVGRLEIILGKLLPYLVLGALAVLLVTAVGGYVFDVPFRGSVLALTVLSLLFL